MIDTIVNNILQDRDIDGGSSNWANWKSKLSIHTCMYCAENHGKIFPINILGENLRYLSKHILSALAYMFQ